jgi:hypothetical protein
MDAGSWIMTRKGIHTYFASSASIRRESLRNLEKYAQEIPG